MNYDAMNNDDNYYAMCHDKNKISVFKRLINSDV